MFLPSTCTHFIMTNLKKKKTNFRIADLEEKVREREIQRKKNLRGNDFKQSYKTMLFESFLLARLNVT